MGRKYKVGKIEMNGRSDLPWTIWIRGPHPVQPYHTGGTFDEVKRIAKRLAKRLSGSELWGGRPIK